MRIWRERDKPIPEPNCLVVKKGMKISRATSSGMVWPSLLICSLPNAVSPCFVAFVGAICLIPMVLAFASMAFFTMLMKT